MMATAVSGGMNRLRQNGVIINAENLVLLLQRMWFYLKKYQPDKLLEKLETIDLFHVFGKNALSSIQTYKIWEKQTHTL